MRLKLILHFLTLVLVISAYHQFVFAVDETSVIPNPINTKPNNPQLQYGPTLVKKRMRNEKTLTASLGYWNGYLEDQNSSISTNFLGLTQTNYNYNFTAQEFGLQLTERGLIGAHAGIKWVAWPGEWWEPFIKGSLGALFKPSESIGTLINFDRYQIQISTGLEDVLKLQRRVRFELGVSKSNLGFAYFANLGLIIGY